MIDWIVLKVSICFFLPTEVPRKLFSLLFSLPLLDTVLHTKVPGLKEARLTPCLLVLLDMVQ